MNKLLAIGIVFLTLAILVIFSKFDLSLSLNTKKQTPQVKAQTTQNVPELATILGPDQEKRLLATRTLVERVDVEPALEILKDSGLPYTGEGHLAVHQVGFYAYKKYGTDAILHCKDYFLNACYHGAIIEAATDQGFDVIAKMVDRCKDNSSRYFQCMHAAGHAILAIWEYDLPKALETCDQLFENKTAFPDTLSSCHNGAFMENLFGVHDFQAREIPKRDWLSNDPYFPCTAFGQKYQKGCWLNQAARIYQLVGGDLKRTAETCQEVKNEEHRAWCFDNLARQIHPLTESSPQKVFELCQNVGESWRQNCIVVNSGAYYSVGDKETAIKVCNLIWESGKEDCLNPIIQFITGDYELDLQKKIDLCKKIEGPYAQHCLNQI